MPSGTFYQGVQPFQRDNTIVNIMEGERERFLASQKAAADKLQKMRNEVSKDIFNPNVKYGFIDASVDLINQTAQKRVDMMKKYENKELSEAEYQKFYGISGQMPKAVQSSYDNFERILDANIKGDPYLNERNVDALMAAANGIKMEINDDGIMMVEYNHLDKKTNKIERKKVTKDAYDTYINSHVAVPKAEKPTDMAMRLGLKFETDISQTSNATGSTYKSGYDVGTTKARGDLVFSGKFGSREDGNNPYVINHAGEYIPYEEAWDNLYGTFKAMNPKIYKQTYTKPTKAPANKPTPQDKAFGSANVRLVRDKSGKPVTTATVNGNKVEGYQLTYKAPDTDQKIEIPTEAKKALALDENASYPMKVDNIFITPDGQMYGKGSFERQDLISTFVENGQNQIVAEKNAELALKNLRKYNDWIPLGTTTSDVMANVFKAGEGIQTKDLYNYADKFATGGSGSGAVTPPTSDPNNPAGIDMDLLK